VEEIQSLVIDPKRLPRRVEHPACVQHQLDALLYLHRYTYPYLATPEPKRPKVGTPEWHDEQAERMYQAEVEEVQDRLNVERPVVGLGEEPQPSEIDPQFNAPRPVVKWERNEVADDSSKGR
jgi:hypothetical protein